MTQAYKAAGPDIVHESFDGDLVVLNLATGQYFGFNATATLLWQVLMAGVQPRQLALPNIALAEVGGFVERLIAQGLIAPAPGAPGVAVPEDLRLALAAATAAPSLEVYEDLADLIIADPIHDVDAETGWPNRIVPE